jgi:iron complex transport system substrate-binding protein
VPCGAPSPRDLPEQSRLVTIPLERVFADSVAHLGLLEELGRTDVVRGVAEGRYLTGEGLLRRFAAGEIVEYGRNEAVNAELVISQKPSAVMTSGIDDGAYMPVQNAGVPVVTNVSWLETSPLGRAEWLKFMAAFLNEERRAAERFHAIRKEYLRLKALVAEVAPEDRVTVTTGTAFRGIYTVAGGKSYAAGLIGDAGGSYVWSDNTDAGSATVDIEQQIQRAANADIWINGGDWKSLDDMISEDRRYAEFKSYRNRQVWVYNLRETASGANDYWSRGVARPDLVLSDLIKIFYPALERDADFQWYRRLEPSAP